MQGPRNWSHRQIDDYEIAVDREGVYQMMMSTEDERFGGDGCDKTASYYTHTNGANNKRPSIRVTLNARRALVLKREV